MTTMQEGTAYFSIEVETSGDLAQDHITAVFIRNGLKKILPLEDFFLEEGGLSFSEPIARLVPLIEDKGLAAILVCPFYAGVEKFFYEMVTKWLIPGKRTAIHFFFYGNFSTQSDLNRKYSFCEARFFCQDTQEYVHVLDDFSLVEAEIRFGAIGLYRGHRILELKGRSSSEKNPFIYERIATLIRQRPADFDGDIFSFMQHFLVSCREEFKQNREALYLTRMIGIFYLFQKELKKRGEEGSQKRQISFKLSLVRLQSPFGIRRVMGVFIGLSSFQSHEVFEESHLLKALKEPIFDSKLVEGSQFVHTNEEEKTRILYLEIEKESGADFSFEEIRYLRSRFPDTLENHIEKLMPSLFMPRNEEEVMKNILILSNQLRYVKDIPQGFISFEEQTNVELTFTVILLRILSESSTMSIKELFQKSSPGFSFLEDRVKNVGILRGKYPKEATVFRIRVPKVFYRRKDHSVDLLRARQDVVREVQKRVGDFRDYNGGMISNQIENLYALREMFPEGKDDLALENFFHLIFPVEMRGVVDPHLLKLLYDLWKRAEKERKEAVLYVQHLKGCVVLLSRFLDKEIGDKITVCIKELGLKSSQSLVFSQKEGECGFLGYILQGLLGAQKEGVLMALQGVAPLFIV